MKRRIVLEVDDDLTTAEMVRIGGCEDAFGLTIFVCKNNGLREHATTAMAEFGITVVSDDKIA